MKHEDDQKQQGEVIDEHQPDPVKEGLTRRRMAELTLKSAVGISLIGFLGTPVADAKSPDCGSGTSSDSDCNTSVSVGFTIVQEDANCGNFISGSQYITLDGDQSCNQTIGTDITDVDDDCNVDFGGQNHLRTPERSLPRAKDQSLWHRGGWR